MRRRFIIAIIAVITLGAWACWHWTGSSVHMPPGSAGSISISLLRQPLATITNTDGLTSIMSMLRSGRPAQQHDCVAKGTMEIRFNDGQARSVAFSPGHELAQYEFGMDGHLFVVSRSLFLESLKAAGVDVQRIPIE